MKNLRGIISFNYCVISGRHIKSTINSSIRKSMLNAMDNILEVHVMVKLSRFKNIHN